MAPIQLTTTSNENEWVISSRGYFVEDLLGKEYSSPLSNTVASTILGRPEFVEQIMADYLEDETDRQGRCRQ